MITANDLFAAGKILKTHGVKGELLCSYQSGAFERCESFFVEIDGLFIPFFIQSRRPKSEQSVLLLLDGVETEAEALEFCGRTVYLPTAMREQQSDYTYDYFIGFSVFIGGRQFGVVADVDDQTANVLFVLDTPRGQVLVPAVGDYVESIDHESRRLDMSIPDGLLDLN